MVTDMDSECIPHRIWQGDPKSGWLVDGESHSQQQWTKTVRRPSIRSLETDLILAGLHLTVCSINLDRVKSKWFWSTDNKRKSIQYYSLSVKAGPRLTTLFIQGKSETKNLETFLHSFHASSPISRIQKHKPRGHNNALVSSTKDWPVKAKQKCDTVQAGFYWFVVTGYLLP